MKSRILYFVFLMTALGSVFGFYKADAQDIHFSQFYNSPLMINPALTGAYNGNIARANVNYKDQRKNGSSAIQTKAVSFDTRVKKKKWNCTVLGLGIFAFDNKEKMSQVGTRSVNISSSIFQDVSATQTFILGVQYGLAQKNIAGVRNFGCGDFSTGILWHYGQAGYFKTTNNSIKATVGFAMFHINQPNQSLNKDSDKLFRKQVWHAHISWRLFNPAFTIIPNAMFVKQGTSKEFLIGSTIAYCLNKNPVDIGNQKESAINLGAYFSTNNTFILVSQLQIASYAIGISYDMVTFSIPGNAKSEMSGLELCIKYQP